MAYKKREENGDTTIRFDSTDMLRIEKLLKIVANETEIQLFTASENEWLSNAQDLFARELPDGRYSI